MKRFKDLLREHTSLLNHCLKIAEGALICYALFFASLGAHLTCLILLSGVFILTPLTFFLEHKKQHLAAGLLFIASTHFYVLGSVISLRNQGGAEYYFLSLATLPLIIFGLHRPLWILGTALLPLAVWGLAISNITPNIPITWTPADLPYKMIYLINFVGSFAIMSIFLGIFVNSMFKLKTAGIQAAEEREQELKKIFESMQEGLVIQDQDGKIVSHNRAALQILGLTSDQLLGRASPDPKWRAVREDDSLFPGEQHPAMIALKTGKPQNNILMGIYQPSEDLRWILINATPMFEGLPAPTRPTGVLATFLDVTERRQIEKKLIETTKLSSLGEMAAGIAHEVNTPLAVISGKTETLRISAISGTLEPQKLISELEKIAKTASRIGKIIKGIKSFSRNSSQDPMSATQLHQMVEDTLELCRDLFKYSGVELRVDYNKDLVFECQATQISQIILNLLRNAHDAVQTLPERWVQLEATQKQDKIFISVTDSGLGIPPETLAKMMQPFFTTKGVGKGTGLGLSISRGIASAHGGQLNYDKSSPHTRFILELPLYHSKTNKKAG